MMTIFVWSKTNNKRGWEINWVRIKGTLNYTQSGGQGIYLECFGYDWILFRILSLFLFLFSPVGIYFSIFILFIYILNYLRIPHIYIIVYIINCCKRSINILLLLFIYFKHNTMSTDFI